MVKEVSSDGGIFAFVPKEILDDFLLQDVKESVQIHQYGYFAGRLLRMDVLVDATFYAHGLKSL